MKIVFKDIEGIEGFTEEQATALDENEALQAAIESQLEEAVNSAVNARVDVAKGEFKKKMDALNDKLVAANEKLEDVPDVSADELKALREDRDKNPELAATIEQIKAKAKETEDLLQEKIKQLDTMKMNHAVTQAINEYDAAFPATAVQADMKDVVGMLAADSLKFDEDSGTFKVYKNGDILATDKGAATPVDWLNMLRDERPTLFKAPAGSGATGSKQNGSATNKKYSDMSESERVALYNSDRESFNKLRGAEQNG